MRRPHAHALELVDLNRAPVSSDATLPEYYGRAKVDPYKQAGKREQGRKSQHKNRREHPLNQALYCEIPLAAAGRGLLDAMVIRDDFLLLARVDAYLFSEDLQLQSAFDTERLQTIEQLHTPYRVRVRK